MMTNNKKVLKFVEDSAALACPDKIVWIDGSEEQRDALRAEAVKTGEMIKLNEELLPDCYLHRTAENDVARVSAAARKRTLCRIPSSNGWIPKRRIRWRPTSRAAR